MPPKRNKSKISFKVFSADNYSRFANRFPFLKERQIKAKLLQAWRNRFTSVSDMRDTTKGKEERGNAKHPNETTSNGADCDHDTPPATQEDDSENTSECSSLTTYSNRRHNKKRRDSLAKDKRNQTANVVNCSSPCFREQSVCDSSSSDLADRKCLKKQKPTQGRKGNELIDLFEEINAEQLLIEPEEMYVADTQVVSSTPVSFNHKEWLAKLTKEVKDEKNKNTVSGMFKWRADRKRKTAQENKEESSYESRFLASNDPEGRSNFFSMFDEEEDIFL